ncbi:MAG: WecB/TagA/CpsF family glycosyltransferase [Bacteroidota bacterium]|nr:WecB/TagA/CpsF family glycosyltransferase [Bacteroidota bacterium]
MNNKYVSKILSVNISNVDLKHTVDLMAECIDKKEKQRVCVLPVNCLLWARKKTELNNIYNSADLKLPDGVPLIWASKFLGNAIKGRVTGLDLLPEFSKVAADKGFTFFFLGAKEGVAEKLSEYLKQKYPNLKVVGVYSPPFAEKFSDSENEKMISMINAVKPNVLWVSLTAPKQDYWIYEHFEKLDVNIAIGVGGAFEVTAGLIKRAPVWMQKNGLEWLYRFLQEPKRLFKRYFVEAPVFIPLILKQKFCSVLSTPVSQAEEN